MAIFFVFVLSFIIFGFGLTGLIAPARLIPFVHWFDNPRGLYLAAAFRILFGFVLIMAASGTQWPFFFTVLGWVVLIAGCLLPFLGMERFHKIVVWWCGQPALILRFWSLAALLFGGILIAGV